MRHSRRIVAALTLLAFSHLGTGCFGSFQLTQKLYGFNKGVGNKWLQELLFLVFIILPVYAFAGLGDAIIFNLIEFWTGSNPLAMAPGETRERVVQQDGKTVKLTLGDQGRTLRIEVSEPGQPARSFTARSDDEGATLREDASGRVLAQAGLDAQGGLVVRDATGEELARRDAAEVALLEAALPAGPSAFVDAERQRGLGSAVALAP